MIRHLAALEDCSLYVVWKLWLEDDVVVEVLLEILCTLVTAMTIVNSEDLDLWPLLLRNLGLLIGRLDDVEDDGDSVLVGLSHQADVCVGSERLDNAKLLV